MTACVNCSRALQPAWKYCIYCGTRTAVAAVAPRSRPLPKRTPVPGFASVTTQATPIVPPPAPAPLAAAPNEPPVSSVWPESLGERPSLRSALAATEVPMPTPPRELDVETPEGEQEAPEPEIFSPPTAVAPAPGPAPEPEPEAELQPEPEPAADPAPAPISIADLVEHEAQAPDPEPEPERDPEPRRSRGRGRRGGPSGGTLVAEPEIDDDTVEELAGDLAPEYEAEPERDRTGSVNTLAVLALLMGVLASPLAALFGHLALGQLKVSGERGVIPAWIAVVLGYLWLGFFIVLGITYLATNG